MTTWRTHHLRARRRRLIHLGIIGAARFTPKMPWLQMSPLKSVEAMAALGRAMDELARAMVESLGVPPWLLSAGPGYLNTGFAAGGTLSARILSDEQLRIAMLAPPPPIFIPMAKAIELGIVKGDRGDRIVIDDPLFCEECQDGGWVQVYSPNPPAFDVCPKCHNQYERECP